MVNGGLRPQPRLAKAGRAKHHENASSRNIVLPPENYGFRAGKVRERSAGGDSMRSAEVRLAFGFAIHPRLHDDYTGHHGSL
jgi:hypothetical protein